MIVDPNINGVSGNASMYASSQCGGAAKKRKTARKSRAKKSKAKKNKSKRSNCACVFCKKKACKGGFFCFL
jgi:hypothetical protein